MSANPAITGIGLMTVLAPTPHDTWTALLAGKSISNHAKIPNINCDNRVNTLAQTVARQALTQSRWTASDLSDDSTALIVATSKGPVESWLANHGPGENGGAAIADVAFSLARSLHMGPGPRLTYSTACASGLHALIRAAELIKHGHARRALVVAAEASVHPLFIQSFNRLGVLAPEGHGCRPFDQSRAGFTMTEAAAAICLEPSKSNSAPALARVDRYALGGDATHLTASDPEAKTLRRLLAQVLNNNPICLITPTAPPPKSTTPSNSARCKILSHKTLPTQICIPTKPPWATASALPVSSPSSSTASPTDPRPSPPTFEPKIPSPPATYRYAQSANTAPSTAAWQ